MRLEVPEVTALGWRKSCVARCPRTLRVTATQALRLWFPESTTAAWPGSLVSASCMAWCKVASRRRIRPSGEGTPRLRAATSSHASQRAIRLRSVASRPDSAARTEKAAWRAPACPRSSQRASARWARR